LDLVAARTQVRLVLSFVGDAAGRVGGDDVIGFLLIYRRCAFRYDRRPVLLVAVDAILGTTPLGHLLTGGQSQRKQAEQCNAKHVLPSAPFPQVEPEGRTMPSSPG
jgi:hypothetical protein